MTTKADDIRHQVSKAYAEAVKRPAPGSCCGTPPIPKGIASALGGYSPEQLSSVPQDAVANSFGCGNPVALAEVGSGEVVLDLGSGAGIDLVLAANKVGPTGRVIGVDMTDEMIAKAEKNIRASGLGNVEVRKGLIESLPVEDGSVDWVISNCVINLSPEKPKVFREIARVLKPGGRMLVSDIVVQDLPSGVREFVALRASCISGAIGEDAYLAGLAQAGLVDTQVRHRLVYDADQLEAVATSDLSGLARDELGQDRLVALVRSLAGKIWSAKIYARKPG